MNEEFDSFNKEPFHNDKDAPVEELRDQTGQTLEEDVRIIERNFELGSRVMTLNLICPRARYEEIVGYIKKLMKIEESSLEELHISEGSDINIVQDRILHSSDDINRSIGNRDLIMVTGIENAMKEGTEAEKAGNWRVVHDFFQDLLEHIKATKFEDSLNEDKCVLVGLALTFDESPQENEAISEAFRSTAIGQYGYSKIFIS